MINEVVVRCLEEKALSQASGSRIALVYGTGLPSVPTAAFRWLDTQGAKYLDMAQQYQHL